MSDSSFTFLMQVIVSMFVRQMFLTMFERVHASVVLSFAYWLLNEGWSPRVLDSCHIFDRSTQVLRCTSVSSMLAFVS